MTALTPVAIDDMGGTNVSRTECVFINDAGCKHYDAVVQAIRRPA